MLNDSAQRTVQKSSDGDANSPLPPVQPSPSDDSVSSLPLGKDLGGREWIPDQVRNDNKPGMTEHEVAPPLFEVERQGGKEGDGSRIKSGMTERGSEKLPSVEISPTVDKNEKKIEKDKFDAQIPKKKTDESPKSIVNKASGQIQEHHLNTKDSLTTIADTEEEEFIKEVEAHSYDHK